MVSDTHNQLATYHSILLQRLERSYGISGDALQWLTSYLSDRYQSVRIRDKQSSVCHVPYGVLQGSVLGPLLFILYIADAATFPEKNMDYLLTSTLTTFSCICRVVRVTLLYAPAESLHASTILLDGWPRTV